MMEVQGLPLATVRAATLTKGGTTTLTVATGHRYYLAYMSVYYLADATVATRIVTPYVDHGTPETHLGKFDVTASQGMRFAAGIGNAAYAAYLTAGSVLAGPMPLVAGDVVNVGVSNGQAGDTWTAYLVYYDVVLST